MSLRLCVLDFETTGKEPKLCRPTEIGAALVDYPTGVEFDTPKKGYVVAHIENLIYAKDYEPLSDEVKEVCPHITDELLQTKGLDYVETITNMLAMFDQFGWPDYMLGHNSEFDETVFREELKRHKPALLEVIGDEIMQKLWALKWVCSIRDIEYNPRFTCKKLSHLALDHGVEMSGRSLHKAIDDVWLLVDLLDAAKVQWDHVIEQFKIPFVIVKAIIPKPWADKGKGKDACKAAKFKWQDIGDFNLPEAWLKRLKQDQIDAESSALGYPLHIVKTL